MAKKKVTSKKFFFVGGPLDGVTISMPEIPDEMVVMPAEVPASIMVLFRPQKYVKCSEDSLRYVEAVNVKK